MLCAIFKVRPWAIRLVLAWIASVAWPVPVLGQDLLGMRLRVTYTCPADPSAPVDRSCRETGEALSNTADPLRWRSDRGVVLTTSLTELIRLERRRPGLSTPEAILVVYLATALGSVGGGAVGCLVGPKSEEDGCLLGATIGLLIGAGTGLHYGREFVAPRKAGWVPVPLPGHGVGLSLGYTLPLPW